MNHDSYYLFRLANGKLREQAIKLHIKRYMEVGFLSREEKDPYQADAIYFTAQSIHTEDVVGVTRLILDKLDKLPTLQNFQIYDLEKARLDQLDAFRYAELSAFTKLPAHDVGLGLIRTVFQYSQHTGITHWICCVDERVFNYMNRIFKFPFQRIGEAKVYMGSRTIPCVLNLYEILASIQVGRPALYQYFTDCQTRYLEVSP